MTAYSLFQDNQINEAIRKLKEFIEMNPTGEHTQYAQYLLAMSYYVQIPDAKEKLIHVWEPEAVGDPIF